MDHPMTRMKRGSPVSGNQQKVVSNWGSNPRSQELKRGLLGDPSNFHGEFPNFLGPEGPGNGRWESCGSTDHSCF